MKGHVIDDVVPSAENYVLTVMADGNVTLPEDILQHLGAQAGSEIVLHKLPSGSVEIQLARRKGSIAAVFGMLKREGQRPISIEEMNEIVERGRAGES
ncbi:AbrB/MazE/SpoVT family DNA-binding domain-containing protein [Sphingomonas sp. dw_22]|uniref:AbrB/MazE/SpoVT family DNA-binding domain-containing protein n=1 Tax=Sphingomonas sp. dw_22 TaxID=2721175 RepID=UPI001BD45344|nr:AbrB/MazE/SpoVT family DNA-binding domain-containing protein [Sphingomonas sp. dw_22]